MLKISIPIQYKTGGVKTPSCKLKKGVIKMKLYAIYDKLSKKLGEPFRAENDEVAKRKFLQTLKEMKKHDIETDDLTVYRIAKYNDTPVLEKDEKGLTGYADIVTDLKAYDLYNVPEDVKIEQEEVDSTFEAAKKIVEEKYNK